MGDEFPSSREFVEEMRWVPSPSALLRCILSCAQWSSFEDADEVKIFLVRFGPACLGQPGDLMQVQEVRISDYLQKTSSIIPRPYCSDPTLQLKNVHI